MCTFLLQVTPTKCDLHLRLLDVPSSNAFFVIWKKRLGGRLRDVRYKCKLLLYRGHTPILNVEYQQGGDSCTNCGPHYRDWQDQEHYVRCDGTDLGPGFRSCNSPAKTILDPPHNECGNFRGVAVYVQGSEFVVKAQLEAGWYRYISEWRFHVDGTLRPRFGFGGVYQGAHCVCQVHHHHVYWRFHFDIVKTWGFRAIRPLCLGTAKPFFSDLRL